MASTLVSSLLSTYLNVLVKDFNKNQLSLGFWAGTCTLKNARLFSLSFLFMRITCFIHSLFFMLADALRDENIRFQRKGIALSSEVTPRIGDSVCYLRFTRVHSALDERVH